MKNILKIATVAVSATLISSATIAATANSTMTVSATVTRTCTVSAGALSFPLSGSTAATAQSAVSISCTAGSSNDIPTVSLSNGLNQTVATSPRNLKGGDSTTALIPYKLSATATGVNLAPTDTVSTTTADGGSSYSTTIHGSIDAGTKQRGSYSDTVTVTVTYAAE